SLKERCHRGVTVTTWSGLWAPLITPFVPHARMGVPRLPASAPASVEAAASALQLSDADVCNASCPYTGGVPMGVTGRGSSSGCSGVQMQLTTIAHGPRVWGGAYSAGVVSHVRVVLQHRTCVSSRLVSRQERARDRSLEESTASLHRARCPHSHQQSHQV
ncbi:hypothetical protein IQ07DRAFT_672207, partial [Pyrenochaeta sp. DS3sAY3a]